MKDRMSWKQTRGGSRVASGNLGSRFSNFLAAAGGLAAAGLLCGCQMLSYAGANGERFWRGSLGAKTSIASLSVEAGTNGLRRLEMQGYQNDSSQALATVTEAAVRAAVQGVK